MPRTHPAYPQQFRERLVELYQNGRTIKQLAAEFEPSEQTIRNWIVQTHLDDDSRTDGLTTDDKDELRRLRKEIRRLQQERDISTHRRWVRQRRRSGSLGRPT